MGVAEVIISFVWDSLTCLESGIILVMPSFVWIKCNFTVPSHSPVPGMWCYIKVTFLHFHVGSSL